MLCDALIYQPLSRRTEFRHFGTAALSKFRHFPRRTPAHRPGRRKAVTATDSLLSKIAGNPFTGCKAGVGTIPQGRPEASREADHASSFVVILCRRVGRDCDR